MNKTSQPENKEYALPALLCRRGIGWHPNRNGVLAGHDWLVCMCMGIIMPGLCTFWYVPSDAGGNWKPPTNIRGTLVSILRHARRQLCNLHIQHFTLITQHQDVKGPLTRLVHCCGYCIGRRFPDLVPLHQQQFPCSLMRAAPEAHGEYPECWLGALNRAGHSKLGVPHDHVAECKPLVQPCPLLHFLQAYTALQSECVPERRACDVLPRQACNRQS